MFFVKVGTDRRYRVQCTSLSEYDTMLHRVLKFIFYSSRLRSQGSHFIKAEILKINLKLTDVKVLLLKFIKKNSFTLYPAHCRVALCLLYCMRELRELT